MKTNKINKSWEKNLVQPQGLPVEQKAATDKSDFLDIALVASVIILVIGVIVATAYASPFYLLWGLIVAPAALSIFFYKGRKLNDKDYKNHVDERTSTFDCSMTNHWNS